MWLLWNFLEAVVEGIGKKERKQLIKIIPFPALTKLTPSLSRCVDRWSQLQRGWGVK
jgi:hypothetical protein